MSSINSDLSLGRFKLLQSIDYISENSNYKITKYM